MKIFLMASMIFVQPLCPLARGEVNRASYFTSSAFIKLEKAAEESKPLAIFLTPGIIWEDGGPASLGGSVCAVIQWQPLIDEFYNEFKASKVKRDEWPAVNGKEFQLSFVFKGSEPLITFRVFKNNEGWYITSQWTPEGGEERFQIFKAEDALVKAIEKNIIKMD